MLEDLGSKNGTYLNGDQVRGHISLSDGDVIRIGSCVLVFHRDVTPMLPLSSEEALFPGRFFAHAISRRLERVVASGAHMLITRPSGSGKELAAQAVRRLLEAKDRGLPFIAHNAADFSSAGEAISMLFGVAKGGFTDVGPRTGLVEQANGGILFLDEAHRYPSQVQASLNRGIETGVLRRSGDSSTYRSSFRLILASNEPPPEFGIITDLLGRMQTVTLPSLEERRADIPSLFDYLLIRHLQQAGLEEEPVLLLISPNHYETLCIGAYRSDNVRGILKLVQMLTGDLKRGASPLLAINQLFIEHFKDRFVETRVRGRSIDQRRSSAPQGTVSIEMLSASGSKYEAHRALIERIYREQGGNVKAVERILRTHHGIQVSYRWLGEYIKNVWKLSRTGG